MEVIIIELNLLNTYCEALRLLSLQENHNITDITHNKGMNKILRIVECVNMVLRRLQRDTFAPIVFYHYYSVGTRVLVT